MVSNGESNTDERGLITQLYLFAFCCVLGALTVIVYLNYGIGLGVIILGSLTALAFWGTTTSAVKVRTIIVAIFS